MRQGTTTRATRILLTIVIVFVLYFYFGAAPAPTSTNFRYEPIRPETYPPSFEIPHPSGRVFHIPKIQTSQPKESTKENGIRQGRLDEIRDTFLHAWKGYKDEAWMHDELRPVSGGYKTHFCEWAATLVDTLDALWIMGLYSEFDAAVEEIRNINFVATEGCDIDIFEATIRHMGGMLAAFDISGGQKKYDILVEKAVELAEVLYTAFDTSNRMPLPHLNWSATDATLNNHQPPEKVSVAVLGSLTLEFTRLTQLTNNPKYYSAVQNVMDELEKWQMQTTIPGLWPVIADATISNDSIKIGSPPNAEREMFSLGALVDSTYEYLGKQHMLLGGRAPGYRKMYENFVEPAKEHLIFRPMTIGNKDILIAGHIDMYEGGNSFHASTLEHLTCFTGGMFAMGGMIFGRPEDVELGRKLTDGCVWAYGNTATGIMPEILTAVPCLNKEVCKWDEDVWYAHIDGANQDPASLTAEDKESIRQKIVEGSLSPGFTSVGDRRYLLRPEAIESVFIMYRITGDAYWAEVGWDMFSSIAAHTRTKLAHSAIEDVTSPSPKRVDEMESFWLAETLKYAYLLYSDWDVVSLDEYVLNTEAHPLRRPK